MARAVRDGGVPLRTAALSSAYGPALSDAFGGFWTHYSQLTPEQRSSLEAIGYDDLSESEKN